ncbi:nitroreductase family protein [Actinomycetes bacterium KLBMP 9797]
MKSSTTWTVDRDGLPRGGLRECLAAATAAPSVHNSQPWRFRLGDGSVEVLVDRERQLPVLDPHGRELMISVGAAVMNLTVAILAHGRVPMLHLLPDPGDPDLAARVTLGPSTHTPPTARMLADAIPQRHTSRHPFKAIAVPPAVLNDLTAAARTELARLTVLDRDTRETVLDLIRIAEHRRRHEPAYWRELSDWTRGAPDRHDGVPVEAFGPWDALETVPIRDFSLVRPVPRRRLATFENAPTIAVLYTPGDTPYHWLHAGQALQRVLLTATVRGLASTLMTQPVELPDLRALLEEGADGYSAQAVLRFGYGPPGAPSPRRPIEDVLA